MKDEKGNVLETVKNDAKGKVKFSTIKYGRDDLGKTFNYTVEEVKGTDTTVTYDNMKVNVTVQVIQPDGGNKVVNSYLLCYSWWKFLWRVRRQNFR